jgi:hypothetical protein
MPITPVPPRTHLQNFLYNQTVPELRPALTLLCAKVLHIHSQVDSLQTLLAADILDATPGPVVHFVEALRTNQSKMDTISKAAKTKLTAGDWNLFSIAMRLTKALQEDRNKIAHYLWACADSHPGHMIFMGSIERLNRDLEGKKLRPVPGSDFRPLLDAHAAIFARRTSQLWWISERDLEADILDHEQVLTVLALCRLLFSRQAHEADTGRALLLQQHRIQTEQKKLPRPGTPRPARTPGRSPP